MSLVGGVVSADHEHPDVETVGTTDVTQTEATLHGEVTAFGEGAGSVDAWFQWDQRFSDGFSNSTERQTLLSPTTFSDTLTGLTADTHYKFRAVAEDDDDGDRGYGDTETFATEAEDDEPVK